MSIPGKSSGRWLIALLLLAGTMLLPPVSAADSGPYHIQIEQVDASKFPLITLFVAITDPDSEKIVGDLTQDQFTVSEDGRPVEIVEFSAGNPGAISTVLTIDHSGSMEAEGKLAGAKEAARAFIDLMRPQDQVALVIFDDTVAVWQDFSTDQALLRQRIDAIAIGSGTAWYDGVWNTVDLMAGVGGRRNAILLSDGLDLREGGLLQRVLGGNGSEHSLDETIQYALANGVAIHTIGLGKQVSSDVENVEGFDEVKLKRMAAETDGTYHHSPKADQLRVLYESFAENTQKEYVITVRSDRASYDGTRRDLAVAVGGSAGSSGYVEQHLLNAQSRPWVALVFIVPLALAGIIPLAWRKTRPAREGSAVQTPPPTPVWKPQEHADPVPGPTAYPEARATIYPPHLPGMPASGSVQGLLQATPCPGCGQPVRVGSRYCSNCGTIQPTGASVAQAASPAQSTTTPCSRCGRPLRSNTRFCSACGQRNFP